MKWKAGAAVVILGLTVACSAQADAQTPAPPVSVSKAEFVRAGKKWPFSVDSGKVGCDLPSSFSGAPTSWTTIHKSLPWFQTKNGKKYALAQFAFGKAAFLDPTPIWIIDREEMKRQGATEADSKWFRVAWVDLYRAAMALCPKQ
jgi:hypothetical protein